METCSGRHSAPIPSDKEMPYYPMRLSFSAPFEALPGYRTPCSVAVMMNQAKDVNSSRVGDKPF